MSGPQGPSPMASLTTYAPPVVVTRGSTDPAAPLVVLLHGRGSDEQAIIGLADLLPEGPAYAAVRAPIAEGGGFAWFANRGIGRPIAASLAQSIAWFREWLDEVAPAGRPVILVGFSGGAAAAGGILLDDPHRFAGGAILYGTMPFDAGLATDPGRLGSLPMFLAQGEQDRVIPGELLQRTWAYLRGDSGADATSYRDGGAHGLTQGALDALNAWLAQRQAPTPTRTPTSLRAAGSRAAPAEPPGRRARTSPRG